MRAGISLAGFCFIAALVAAAFADSPEPAAAAATYACSGRAGTDEPILQSLIDGGGTIVLQGPIACAGNYVADGVSVSISGAGDGASLDGGGTGSILVADHATVTLANLTLVNGNGSGPDEPGDSSGANGGAVSITDSALTVTDCRIVRNRAADQGGGIHAAESTLTIADTVIANNTSLEGGGGIDADDDVDLTITRSTISRNATGPHGGGVELFDGSLTVTRSTISRNRLTASSDFRSGAGIWTGLSVVTVIHSTVSRNVSPEFGGGIGFSGGDGSSLTLLDSAVIRNRAAVGGGGIRNDAYYGDAPLVVQRSTIAGNSAGQGGGIDAYALHGFTSSVTVAESTVSANRAPGGLGGGIDGYVDPTGGTTSIDVDSTRIARNRASFGAGIAASGANGSAAIVLRPGATLIGNRAAFDGGGVFTRTGASLSIVPEALMRLNFPDDVANG